MTGDLVLVVSCWFCFCCCLIPLFVGRFLFVRCFFLVQQARQSHETMKYWNCVHVILLFFSYIIIHLNFAIYSNWTYYQNNVMCLAEAKKISWRKPTPDSQTFPHPLCYVWMNTCEWEIGWTWMNLDPNIQGVSRSHFHDIWHVSLQICAILVLYGMFFVLCFVSIYVICMLFFR